MADKHTQLEDSKIWQEANDLANFVYSKLDDFPEEEKWNSVSKLRNAANDLVYAVGEAVGNINTSGAEYDWARLARAASSLKNMYHFAGKQEFIPLDSQILARLTRFILDVFREYDKQKAATEMFERNYTEKQDEKYRKWKEMNDKG